jgi:hypothetical protein
MIEETKKEFRRLESSTLCNVLADAALAADYIDELENVCEARYREMVRLQNCNLDWSKKLSCALQLLRELDIDLEFTAREMPVRIYKDSETHLQIKEILKEQQWNDTEMSR